MIENRHMRRGAARERPATAVAHQACASRVLLMLLALLALTFQVLVVQTHVHIPQTVSSPRAASVTAGTLRAFAPSAIFESAVKTPNAQDGKNPLGEDPSNCPLCQAAYASQFVQSAAVLAALPCSISVGFIPWSQAAAAFFAITHIWNSRAPPLHSAIS